jgi:indole-3-glycerol phosphate synthase
METTTRLVATAPKDVSIIALSGVKSREDVLKYEKIGVVGVLVGEGLMTSDNPTNLIKSFIGKE